MTRSDPVGRGVVAVLVTGFSGAEPASLEVPVVPGYTVDVLTPSGGRLIGPDGTTVIATTAFAAVRVGDYAVLAVPGGAVGARLQDEPDAVRLLRAFAASGALRGAAEAAPRTMDDTAPDSDALAVLWQEVGPGIHEVSGTGAAGTTRRALPRRLVRIAARVYEQVPV